MTLKVALRHPGSSTSFNETTQRTDLIPEAPYCTNLLSRIQAHRETAQDADSSSAEESVRTSGYLVTLPLSASLTTLAVGDLIDVPTNCADPLLAGHSLRIVDLVRGTLRFERDVFAVINDTAETR